MNYTAEVLSKTQLTHKMYKLVVRLLEPSEMTFKAGQCVAFHVNERNKRLYSIASLPEQKNVLDFYIDISPGGLGSQFVLNLQKGNTFQISGPFGIFTFPEIDTNFLLIATGSGLAPYISMVPDFLNRSIQNDQANKNQSIELWLGLRHQEDIFAQEELNAASQNKKFSYTISLSQPHEGWHGATGRVTEHLLNMPEENFKEKLAYICGSTQMIKDVRSILMQKGVSPKNIKVEIFG